MGYLSFCLLQTGWLPKIQTHWQQGDQEPLLTGRVSQLSCYEFELTARGRENGPG